MKAPELMKCAAIDEDTCRALFCPRHRKRLAYCPWEKNGHAKPATPDAQPQTEVAA